MQIVADVSSFEKLVPSKEVAYVAALLPSPPLTASPSPPSVHRRLRRDNGSSESDKALRLEDSEVWNEDYRAGGPNLPRLPAINEHIGRDDPLQILWDNELEQPVRRVLSKWNINSFLTGPIRRAHRVEVVREWRDTVLITGTKGSVEDDNWFEACKEIRRIFLEKNHPELTVEIIDERCASTRLTFSIASNEEFVVEVWPTLRPQILEKLGENDWTLLCVVRRGESFDKSEITIAITVREESTSDWKGVTDAIVALLDAQKLDNVALEIYRGELASATPREEVLLDRRDWELEARFGGSLSPCGFDKYSSSLGGMIDLEMANGTRKTLGLTNFHCVTDKNHSEAWDKNGILPNDPSNKLRVDHPSLADHNASLKNYRDVIEEIRNDIPLDRAAEIEQNYPSLTGDQNIRYYQRLSTQLSQTQELVEHAERFFEDGNLYLGNVYASSGFRVNNKRFMLDWALIEMRQDRIGKNVLFKIDDLTPARSIGYNPQNSLLRGIASLEDDMYLFKVGRTTGFTKGCLNGEKLADIQSWYRNKDGQMDKIRSKAYLITPYRDGIYGDPGDYGSFVFNGSGEFAGLYVGGDSYQSTGLMIAASDLFSDIQDITGAKSISIP